MINFSGKLMSEKISIIIQNNKKSDFLTSQYQQSQK